MNIIAINVSTKTYLGFQFYQSSDFHFFSKGHHFLAWKTGLCYGFLIGLLMMVAAAFNQYAVYNIPFSLAIKWFVFGLIQLIICGIVVSLIYKPKEEVKE